MTNYNERLDEILREMRYRTLEDSGLTVNGLITIEQETKQALTSLIKELVAEAKPELPALFTELNDISVIMYKKGTNQFEQNLLKALEEV